MPEDASLDQFESDASDAADQEDGRDAERDGRSAESDAASTGPAVEASAVDPAVSTFAWSPEGGECAACGATVERRWRADGEREGDLVCADCKSW